MKEGNLTSLHVIWFELHDIRKRQKYGDVKHISDCQRLGGREGWLGGAQSSKTVLRGPVMMDTYHYTVIQTRGMYSTKCDPNVNYGL